jgi:hypothetical protein
VHQQHLAVEFSICGKKAGRIAHRHRKFTQLSYARSLCGPRWRRISRDIRMKKKPTPMTSVPESRSAFTTPLRIVLATTAAFWMGGLQAQVQAPQATRNTSEIRFRDFFRAPAGPDGLEISDTLRRAQGSSVRLVGYMVQQEAAPLGRFLLTPRPLQMGQHADGEADDTP